MGFEKKMIQYDDPDEEVLKNTYTFLKKVAFFVGLIVGPCYPTATLTLSAL